MTNRPLAFICSPYAGDIEKNVARARELCRLAVDDGYTPIAPHLLYPQFLSEETERNLGIEMGLQWLEFCHIMYCRFHGTSIIFTWKKVNGYIISMFKC